MKERPILMTPENAQRCFDGTKTQTRRIVKETAPYLYVEPHYDERGAVVLSVDRDTGDYAEYWPFGGVGDRLWVREAWQEKAWSLAELNRAGFLSAPRNPRETYLNQDLYAIHKGGYNTAIGDPGRWHPSIHMPRWACRTVLEITEVRVERLWAITTDDIRAEGVRAVWPEEDEPASAGGTYVTEAVLLRDAWKILWESINGNGSWALNPWVWVLSFTRLKG